ncbi:CopG domain protein DNA-binding domain protein (plasmid) [Caldicellulosiruptor acetigenus I77R1B]|uniref:CopG domain protein DNA-binding domain protein n=1 Tax=Caldicellulosiruptor acetigenus (strain ATCC 700853 / DSM 12137 / I77R1B) TaxID=632335 RepID=E4SAY5_CALA7|nr:ribbon-helix-helix protein, CopG family [Caldicellulosiruptor acetigenus]ADQ42064.1 CopG domain protein DNA-binding domain protein [Caldicellulosiruptor acetigenus I77R1B]
MEKMKSVNLKLPEHLFKEVEKLAKRKGQSKSSLIRFVVAEYLEREKEKQKEI